MKTIKFTILALIILVCISTGFSEYLTPELLKCPQWKSSWCWAGAAQACLTYYGIDHDSVSNEDCAHVITTNNSPQPMRVITTIINHFLPGYAYDPANNLNSEADYKAEADSGAPFACFWPNHFVTYAGYEGDKHLIMNPWPYGEDSSTAGAWEENCTYSYIANKTSSYVRTKGMPRTPFVTVRTPNGGEEFEISSTSSILWSDNIDGNVKIELFKGGTLKEALAASTESDGLFEWAIPGNYEKGTDYKIKITSIDSTALNDESDENFSITDEYIIVCPYFQSFDTLETGKTTLPRKWEQLSLDDLDWLVWTGKTPSKEPDQGAATGPDGDHTSSSGNYLYVESSGSNNPDKKADYTTPKFNFKSLQDPKLSFWCHMFSDNEGEDQMGDLYLDVCVDGNWSNDVVHLTNDHGDAWFEQTVDLNSYKGDRVIFRFRAVTGSGWASDICVDDFKIEGVLEADNTITHPVSYDLKFYRSKIYFQVPNNIGQSRVRITLFNSQGKAVRTLVNDHLNPGSYSVSMERYNNNLAAGLYLCRMETGNFIKTINVVITK